MRLARLQHRVERHGAEALAVVGVVHAVLFDLDDTLFDHRRSARTALAELHAGHAAFQPTAFAEFERLHATLLEELHHRVMTGEMPLDAAREERFRRLFEATGVAAGPATVAAAAATYRDGYRRARHAVDGAAELLAAIRQQARIGIVSNNLLEEQQDKLRHCGLERHVDVLTVSEEAGMSKPDPRIFEIALKRLGCGAEAAVMVGDSWAADITGARAAGIRPIWFNPAGKPSPDPDAGIAELRALAPADPALQVILDQRFGPGV